MPDFNKKMHSMPDSSDMPTPANDNDEMAEAAQNTGDLPPSTDAEKSPGGETGHDAAPMTGTADASDISGLDITHPVDALDPVCLDELPQSMQDACARAGWTNLMPVQSLALPYLMDGRDIMIQSRTGSGKTGCYLLPLVPSLRPDSPETQALVLVPTRELALQVADQAAHIFADTGVRTAALYGGVGYKKQLDQLEEGAHLVIGTPGRILDHILRRSLVLDRLRALVFDEADRMLSIGFYPDMKEIQRYLPRRRVYTSLFSATYPPYVLNLANEFMQNPSLLSLSQKQVYVAEVQHCFCQVAAMDKDRALVRLIEMENPGSAIVFCNTKANVHYITGVLKGFGYNADEISADLSQAGREDVMRRVREGRVRILVATDVAARGIDIPCLSHVFLYEPPEDHESYIHRAGRTGRANAAGTVISLVDIMERMELDRIARHYSLKLIELADPTEEDVARVASTRLTALLESRYRSLNALQRQRAARYETLARELATQDEDEDNAGAELLAMLLDAFHHNSLNELALPRQRAPQGEKPQGKRAKKRKGSSRNDGAAAENQGEESANGHHPGNDNADEGSGEGTKRRRRRRGSRGKGRKKGGEDETGAPSSSGSGEGASPDDHGQAPEGG